MLTRQVTLQVRHDFVLPEVYQKGNWEEVEEALWIGSLVQQSIRTRRSNEEIRSLTEIKDKEIEHIQSSYQDQLTKLLDDIRALRQEKDRLQMQYADGLKEARILERDVVTRESEEKLRLLRKEQEILQSRLEAVEVRRRVVEEAREKDVQEAVKRTEQMMEKIIGSKQEQLSKMEVSYQRLHDVIQRQSEEITKLTSVVGKRGANVKTKGSDYEEEFGEKLRRHFGLCRGFSLKDTRLGSGHEMDFSMEMDGQIVMWELKNYGATVPKAEVDKFLRDLKENPQAKIGVMISRSTDIYGKSPYGLMHTEFDQDKMMIYLSRFEEFCGEDEHRVFQMLTSLFRVWWQYHHEETNTFDRADIVRELEKAMEDVSKRRTEWRRHKAHLDELGRWTTDLLDESEGRLDRLLKKARNTEEPNVNGPLVIPEGVFRDSGEEKEMTWMRSIMKVCSPGGEMEVRELVELLSLQHKLSKDTIRSNVMSIVRDSAVLKKGVVKYIRGISKFVPPCEIRLS
jgi:hypothetical protein